MSKFFETGPSSRSSSINSHFLKSNGSTPTTATSTGGVTANKPFSSSTSRSSSKKPTRENLHKLSDFWSVWYHQRSSNNHNPSSQQHLRQPQKPPEPQIPTTTEEQTSESTTGDEKTATDSTSTTAITSNPNSEDASSADGATANGGDQQQQQPKLQPLQEYLQDIHLVEFPQIGSPLNENTSKIDSVEQLWQALVNLKTPDELPHGTEWFVFKNDIKPIWEDPANASGGRWVYSFDRTPQKIRQLQQQSQKPLSREEAASKLRQRASLIWERLIIKLCSGNFIPDDNLFQQVIADDICGVTLSVREDRDIICIWNTHIAYNKYVKDEISKCKKAAERLDEFMNEEEAQLHDTLESIIDGDANIELDHLQQQLTSVENQQEEEENSNEHGNSNAFSKERSLRDIIKLTPFLLTRGIADSMYRVINEADMIQKNGVSPVDAFDDGSSIDIKNSVDKSKYKMHSYYTQTSNGNGNNNNNGNKKRQTKKDGKGRKRGPSNIRSGNNTNGIDYLNTNGNSNGSNTSYSSSFFNNNGRKYKPRRFKETSTSSANPANGTTDDVEGSAGPAYAHPHSNLHYYHNQTYTNSGNNNTNGSSTDGEWSSVGRGGHIQHATHNGHGSGNSLDNKFSDLGKQRKRLDLDDDGNVVDEVNMLSFGSRRRRMMQQHASQQKQ
ncbi:unnamed protein product [Ambrosiozyma monospora]|uniref:Unnamed protein product n=1 Tax=Ambrosiozyma monospora TaxID=43982 RepID=A0A9W6YT31_AMBMO|nr:unnamed protein product [Ambrosiozyma monospora]